MKKLIFITLSFALLLTSCKKDNVDANANAFTYDGKSYSLSQGFITDYGDEYKTGTSNYDISLYSSGVAVNSTTGKLSGKGNGIYIELISTKLKSLPDGTYPFSLKKQAGSLIAAAAGMDFDFSSLYSVASPNPLATSETTLNKIKTIQKATSFTNGEDYKTTEGSTGKVIIKKSGSNYIIDFEFTVETGKTVKGQYNGTLTIPEFD